MDAISSDHAKKLYPKRIARIQFSLRWLLAAMLGIALCAVVARQGWIEAIGTGAAMILIGIALQLRGFPFSIVFRSLTIFAACAILWMVAVDYSTYLIGCNHCGLHWHAGEWRIYGTVVQSRRTEKHSPLWAYIAQDLGTPCPHEFVRLHRVRLWGLMYAHPRNGGICCLSIGNEWYDEAQRTRVRQMGKDDPTLGDEFRSRLLDKDFDYLMTFGMNLRASASP